MEAEKFEFPNKGEWLEFRRAGPGGIGGIGGSNAANILGVGWKSSLDEWAWYRRLIEDDPGTEKMEWGIRLEPLIREGFEKETGQTVEGQGIHTFVSKKYDFIRYSADGLIIPGTHLRPHKIFESKCTGYLTRQTLEEDFPLAWDVQGQHGLFCLGLDTVSFAVLVNGNQLLWKDIERNDSFIEQMLDKELEFWEMVKSGTPPDADYRESTKETISKLYPKDTGATIQLPPEAVEWATASASAEAIMKQAKKTKDEADNKLRMAIGENTFGILPNGQSYSWKWQERKAYEVKATEFRVLRRKGK